ncbi:MAG: UDP-N-acetylglucosamine 1-carboxyvinyltransferase, partial [Deltaproteobacteria bacterium]|nr:UDP-N-acetylglucosamine 1-carboxyvinyltransferase [Deltaproteobacteria bacterium]
MERIVIEGGSASLKGTVKISGAKNAALPAIAACLLTGGWHHLHRIPQLRDIRTIKVIMSQMGVDFEEEGGALLVNTDHLREHVAPY